MKRGKEAIKTKHVVRLCCGRSQGLVPFACLRSISPSPLIDTGRLTDSRLVFSLLSRLFQSTHLYFFDHTNTSSRSIRQAHPPTFRHLPTRLHGFLKSLFIMGTHGPINGVKINRACSGSFAHRCPFPFLFPSARTSGAHTFFGHSVS